MKVLVCHEVEPDVLDSVLREGIKQDTHGEKSDSLVERVDSYLDSRRPDDVVANGLSRAHVIYGYLCDGDKLFDIRDGATVHVEKFAAQRQLVLLQLAVDAKHCFVSDLAIYDAMTHAMERGEADTVLRELADRYWRRLTSIEHFEREQFCRPEAMITSDIAPSEITVVSVDQ
jgi:hypothetical protein